MRQVIWLIAFSIAMGFLETAVVVYLRELYYPNGFVFPLTAMTPLAGLVEVFREAATIIMLLGIGILAGRTFNQRMAFFVAAFAIWDLCYYLFLKLLLDWPASWLTWDILFLIPLPWIGPVLAPCLVCVVMLLFSGALYWRDRQDNAVRYSWKEWLLVLAGCLVIVFSWTGDFWQYRTMQGTDTLKALATYIPQSYNWWLFGLGEVLILAGIAFFSRRTKAQP